MTELVGGIPVAGPTDPAGVLVHQFGHVQYGRVLAGAGSSVGVVRVYGWRDLPDADVADSVRPQAHGAYAGSVFGGALTVTVDYLIRGLPDAKALAVDAFEKHHPMDDVERVLAVDDGGGTWFRMARVIAREVPQDKGYRHGPVPVSVQYLCADPRRYRLTERTGVLSLPATTGGLTYPLDYPLDYGADSTPTLTAANDGGVAAPFVVTFTGPITTPQLASPLWRFGFALTLTAGEHLTVDTAAGTAYLNGTADRLYAILPASDPLEVCLIPPDGTTLVLTATEGTGTALVSHHDARL